jgi:phage baseplate assembly protein gpV
MAVLDGYLCRTAEPGSANARLSLGLSDLKFLDWPPRDSIVNTAERTAFAVASALPVTVDVAHAIDALIPTAFFDDFYNRVHVRPSVISLGYVISEQSFVVDVWNAYLTPVTLTGINGVGDGLSVTGSMTFPVTFGAIQLNGYEVSASRQGPSTIDALLTWVFTDPANDPACNITGSRVLAWTFPMNWATPLRETLTWLTDVLKSEDSSEQRYTLRAAPRASYSFAFDVDSRQRRLIENQVYGLGGTPWAVPYWPDGSRSTAPVTAGDLVVPVDTTLRDFEEGGLALLLSEDGSSFEAFQIESIASGALTAVRVIENTWPANTWVYPARIAQITEVPQLRRLTQNDIAGTVSFETLDGVFRTYTAESPTYRGQPVLEREPNWRDGVAASYRRQLEIFDTLLTQPHRVDRSKLGEPTRDFLWTAFGRAEIAELRKFLYARAGRYRGIWVPTFMDDVVLSAPMSGGVVSMFIEACGASPHAGGNNRRDIRIQLNDGTIFYRRVDATSTIDSATESLTLSAPLGVDVAPSEVALISWMEYLRLDQDAVEIEWPAATVAETLLTLTGPRNAI